jgi:hypothetical protein
MKPKNKKEDKINNININNKEKNNKNKVITKYNSKKSYDMKDDIKNKNKKNEINKNKSQSSFLRRKAYNIKFIPSKKSNSKKKRYSTNFYIDLQKINNEVNKESYKKNIYTVNLNDTLNNNINENNNNKSIISNNNSNNNLNNSYFKLYTNRSANTSSKNWRAKTPNKNNYNNKENKTLSIDKKLDKNYFDKILENNKKRENYIKNYKFNEYKDIRLLENIFLKNNNNQNNNNNNLYNIIKIKYSEINKNKSAPALKKIKKENPIKLTNLKINHKFNNQYLNNDNQVINNNNKVDKDYSYDALINKINLNNSNENITNTAKELIENKNKLLNDIITKAGIEIKI